MQPFSSFRDPRPGGFTLDGYCIGYQWLSFEFKN